MNKEIMIKSISKMAKLPKNGVRKVVFLTEVDFIRQFHQDIFLLKSCSKSKVALFLAFLNYFFKGLTS